MNRMFSWPRLLPKFRAAAAAAAAAGLLDVLLAVAFGHTPDWLCGVFDAEVFDRFGSRLAKVQQMKSAGRIDEQKLIAMIGLSPVREDTDPALLEANDPDHRGWLILGAQGRTFATLDVYARTLADSGIHARQVAIGIMPSMLHHDDDAVPVDAAISRLPHHLRHFQIHHVLLDLSWVYRNSNALADQATLVMYEAATRSRLIFGLPMSAAYAPESDAFTSWTSVLNAHSNAEHMVLQWDGHRQLLVPEQFQSIDRQINSFARTVNRLRAGGSEVVLILMPETSRLRGIYPQIIEQRFGEAVRIASAGAPLQIIDMRAAVDDDLFWDDGHLNPQGRRVFSSELPGKIPGGK